MAVAAGSLQDRGAEHPEHQKKGQRVLVVTAVPAERDAVLRGTQGDGRIAVIAAGAGPAAAAAGTAAELARGGWSLAVSAGIAGGFAGRADIGTLVVASEMIAADFGAETAEGFRGADELGFGSTRIRPDPLLAERLAAALAAAGLAACAGPVLTVSTATGTAATAEERARRVPGAVAEAMEGYGVALAAARFGVPVLEIRAISNAVGPRDRSAWRIDEALQALTAASAVLKEVMLP